MAKQFFVLGIGGTGHDCVESSNIASYLAGKIISKIGAQFDLSQIEEIKEFINNNFN